MPILAGTLFNRSTAIPLTSLLISFDFNAAAEDVLRSGSRIVLIVIVAFVVVRLAERGINPLIRMAIREQMEDEPEIEITKRIDTLSSVIYKTLVGLVVGFVIIMILPEFGVDATALIAGLGLFGLAVGFGAQSLVKDMINGVFILTENQYGKGDVVTVSNIVGIVEDINLRRTVIRDLDGTVHFIPHSTVDVASNWTKSYSCVNLNVRVSYSENLERAIQVVNRVGKELSEDPNYAGKILDPPHVLRVDSFEDSWIELKIFGETAPIEQWGIMGELRLRLKLAFDEEGIEIPLPQRTLHMATPVSMQRDGSKVPMGPQPAYGTSSSPSVSGGGQPGDIKLTDDDGDGGEGEP